MLESGKHPALNFVIIGGGPTGVELAGAISDIAKLYIRKDFKHIDPASAQSADFGGFAGDPLRVSGRPAKEWVAAVARTWGVIVRTGAARD